LDFHVAFEADDGFILAWLVANGENNGASFDWDAGRWASPK
jgi:hypothetical protein